MKASYSLLIVKSEKEMKNNSKMYSDSNLNISFFLNFDVPEFAFSVLSILIQCGKIKVLLSL